MPIVLRTFNGEVPRLPAERLPEEAAQRAVNCDFAHGELRSLRALGPTIPTAVAPVRGLFSDDGERFFAWDQPTRAYLSPTIDDTHGRVYYQSGAGPLRVAQTANMRQWYDTPGAPTVSYAVGVKRPTATLTATVGGNAWWGPDVNVEIYAQCVAGTTIMSEERVPAFTVETPGISYLVSVPNTCGVAGRTPEAGWIAGDKALTWRNVTTNEDGVVSVVPRTLAAAAWRINSGGGVEEYNGTAWAAVAVQTPLTYDGEQYTNAVTLYNDLLAGTAGLSAPTQTTRQFRLRATRIATGVAVYDAAVDMLDMGGDQYRLTVDPADALLPTETVSIVAVAINEWDEESAPSDPVTLEHLAGQPITIEIAHAADPDQVPLAGMLIYRTYGNTPAFFLLSETPAVAVDGRYTIIDSSEVPQTTVALASTTWDAPPADLRNLVYVGNGAFMGSSGKDLLFSEPYHPHAWPYRMTLPHAVVGTVAIENGALVTTTAQTTLVMGSHPSSMSQQLLPVEQAGVSGTSITRVEGAAIYASNDGLVDTFGGQPSTRSSQALFAREDWRTAYRSAFAELVLAAHDGRVVGIVPPGSGADSFLIRLDEDAGSFSRIDVGDIYGAGVVQVKDALYVGLADGIAEFACTDRRDKLTQGLFEESTPGFILLDSGALLTASVIEEEVIAPTLLPFEWHSRDYQYPHWAKFSAGILDCEGDVTLEIIADGVVHTTVQASGYKRFRVAPGTARVWSMRLTGVGVVRSLKLGASFLSLGETA